MVLDPDAMWRRGFTPPDGPKTPERPTPADPADTGEQPPQPVRETLTGADEIAAGHVELTLDELTTPHDLPGGPGPARTTRTHRKLRLTVTALVVALLATGLTLAITRAGDDKQADFEPADYEQVRGADQRRLPGSADLLWTTTIPATPGPTTPATTAAAIIGGQPVRLNQYLIVDQTAVVAVLPAADNKSVAIGLDALSGAELWRRPFDFAATAVNLLGALDGTLILEQNDLDGRQLIGVDVDTGTTIWDQPTRDNGVHVILSGTDVVTRVSFTGTERLTFIDPATGVEASRATGRLIGTDLAGTWYVESGRRVDAIDLTSGPSDPVNIAERRDGWNGPTAVVDGRVIVLDDSGRVAIAPLGDAALVPLVVTGGELSDVVSFVASGGPNLMAIGDGKVIGLTIVGGAAEIKWTRSGSLRAVNVSDRAMLVTLSNAALEFGDVSAATALAIIDAVSGQQLGTADSVPDVDDLPRLVGNGFMITDMAQLGQQRVGYDLNGNALWRLPSNDPIQIGKGVMVTINAGADGYVLSGFGDDT